LYARRIAGTYPSLSVVFAEAVTFDIMLEGVVVKEELEGEDGSSDERNGKGMIGPVGKRFIVSSGSFDVTGMGESRGSDMIVFPS
jgi:hypothetical protein